MEEESQPSSYRFDEEELLDLKDEPGIDLENDEEYAEIIGRSSKKNKKSSRKSKQSSAKKSDYGMHMGEFVPVEDDEWAQEEGMSLRSKKSRDMMMQDIDDWEGEDDAEGGMESFLPIGLKKSKDSLRTRDAANVQDSARSKKD